MAGLGRAAAILRVLISPPNRYPIGPNEIASTMSIKLWTTVSGVEPRHTCPPDHPADNSKQSCTHVTRGMKEQYVLQNSLARLRYILSISKSPTQMSMMMLSSPTILGFRTIVHLQTRAASFGEPLGKTPTNLRPPELLLILQLYEEVIFVV
jgi:hypothetical protein